VTLEVQVENDGALTIIITDTGVGIASKDLARVSQPFFQADSSNERRYEGAGLGLWLTVFRKKARNRAEYARFRNNINTLRTGWRWAQSSANPALVQFPC
jgi:signal transduction histidine kinase